MEDKDKNNIRHLTRNYVSKEKWTEIFQVLKGKNTTLEF